MKIFNFFTRNKEKKKTGNFADFFLHASDKEKKKVFIDAARRANEDQRSLVEHINELHQKTT
jgi:hypothetical protein